MQQVPVSLRWRVGSSRASSMSWRLSSRNRTVQLGMHNDALLSGGLIAGAHDHRWNRATVDRDVRYAGWDEDVVTGMRLLAVLQPITGPQLELLATQKVERSLMLFVDVRLRALPGWKRDHPEPQHA